MMSVRLEPELDERVRRAASAEGVTVSDFVRAAVIERADRTLAASTRERLADVIGVVRGDGGDVASRTGEAFTELLESRRRR